MNWLFDPWPWYFSGPLIGVIMLTARLFGKRFGVSSTYKAACSMSGAGKRVKFFDYDWKQHVWMLLMGLGSIIGGYIASNYLSGDQMIELSSATQEQLSTFGLGNFETDFIPSEIYSWSGVLTPRGFIVVVIGGFLIGFGARYAGGCTSGHGISGLSEFQLPSLLAIIGYFIGGLFVTYILIPIIFSL